MAGKRVFLSYMVATVAGLVAATAILIGIDATILRIPETLPSSPIPSSQSRGSDRPLDAGSPSDYKAITERNLFRAKLQAEIPKPKTEKEIEDEALTGIVRTMALKGVMLGTRQKENYAVIDRGGQKGVWTYEVGDVIERGLAVKEIRKDSVRVEKGEFGAVLRLFSPVVERTAGPQVASAAPSVQDSSRKAGQETGKLDLTKEIRKQGSVTLISKSLAETLKSDSNMVMSSIAVKVAPDGLKVVTVDRGSIAQRVGIAPDDTLQEVNGYRLNSSQDLNKVYEALKSANSFELKVLRRGKPETLRYEIR